MGLNETLAEISKELKDLKSEKEEKVKPFKLPFGKKVSKSQLKKNYVLVIKVNENGNPEWRKEQIKEQTVMIDGVPRIATPEYIIPYKKTPVMVIPSWSVEPINWKRHHEESLFNNTNTAGYQLLLNRMKLSGVEGMKPKMKGWIAWVLGAIVLGVIVYALFTGAI